MTADTNSKESKAFDPQTDTLIYTLLYVIHLIHRACQTSSVTAKVRSENLILILKENMSNMLSMAMLNETYNSQVKVSKMLYK